MNTCNGWAETSISSVESICPDALDVRRRKRGDGQNTQDSGKGRPDEEDSSSSAELELACAAVEGAGKVSGVGRVVAGERCAPEMCEERGKAVLQDARLSRVDVTVNNAEMDVYDALLYIPAAGVGSVK